MSDEEEWISAATARAMGSTGTDFADAIVEHAKAGLVRAKAKLLVSERTDQSDRQRDCEIPQSFWQCGLSKENWDQGSFAVWSIPTSSAWMAGPGAFDTCAYGVEFKLTDIKALLPSFASAPYPPSKVYAAGKRTGGSPGKFDWARAVGSIIFLWADSGSWEPKSQTEVQEKLAAWFTKNDQSPDLKQIKLYSRWLF